MQRSAEAPISRLLPAALGILFVAGPAVAPSVQEGDAFREARERMVREQIASPALGEYAVEDGRVLGAMR
ncbi:MAG: hypothetical protein V3S91_02680, partial [Gemmatimonadota bacterium]